MVERILADLYRSIDRRVRSKKVGVFMSSEIMNTQVLKLLPDLRSKLKIWGELKYATVIYEGILPENHFQYLRDAGFSHRIVPSNLQLNIIIEVYDHFLREEIDIIIIGADDENLIPMFTEIRKNCTVYGITVKNDLKSGIVESLDGVINLVNLDEFSFDEASFPEFTIEGSSQTQHDVNMEEDLANIGPTSEKFTEDINGN